MPLDLGHCDCCFIFVYVLFAVGRNLMRVESPHSVESPKLTPSPPSNVPPNIHQVSCVYTNKWKNYLTTLILNSSNSLTKYRKTLVVQRIFTRPQQIILQTKQIVPLWPIHRCHYLTTVVHKISVTHKPCMFILGHLQMWLTCSHERSSLQLYSYRMRCATIFYHVTKLPILLTMHRTQVWNDANNRLPFADT